MSPVHDSAQSPVVDERVIDLFRSALVWAMTYGPVLNQEQWDEREKMIQELSEKLSAVLTSAPVAGEVRIPPGYRVKVVEGHGYRITAPSGSDWVAHNGTPAGDLIAALLAAPQASGAASTVWKHTHRASGEVKLSLEDLAELPFNRDKWESVPHYAVANERPGYVLVPVKPTPDMIERVTPHASAGHGAAAIYKGTIKAALVCQRCGGTGEADSGGTHPWGAPALIPCECTLAPLPIIDLKEYGVLTDAVIHGGVCINTEKPHQVNNVRVIVDDTWPPVIDLGSLGMLHSAAIHGAVIVRGERGEQFLNNDVTHQQPIKGMQCLSS